MRIGIICEGGPVTNVRNATTDNPDARVLERCINLMAPGHDFEFIPLGNKPNLKKECGTVARKLITIYSCDVVLVCWDLYPGWSDVSRPCRAQDRADVLASLAQAGVNHPHVYLLCVEAELETMLLRDERALSAVLSTRTRQVTIRGNGGGQGGNNPKAALAKLFGTHGHRYNPAVHNPLIARAIPDMVRLRRDPSFARLIAKLRLARVVVP